MTYCDEQNRGRLGYVDVSPSNPFEVLVYSREPLLDIGERGRFDENGVVTTCILAEDEAIYAYYCGFQKHINYPYSSLARVAISKDGGNTFHRVRETPLLERCDGEMFIRKGVGIYKFGNIFHLYYAGGNEWFEENGKWLPKYSLKYIESAVPDSFVGESKELIALENDEFGMPSPQIIKVGDSYKMIYSIRSRSKGYRMGFAESYDGIHFIRNDQMMEIDTPLNGFDSEMVCYGKCFDYEGRIYLFYSGNHYGMDGMGWAELEGE